MINMNITENKKKKVKDPIGFIKIMKTAFPIIYKTCPVYFTVQQFISVLHGLSHAVIVTATAVFFNNVLLVVNGEKTAADIIPWLVLYGGVIILIQVLNGVHNFMHGVVANKLSGYTAYKMHEKSSRIDPVMYENPENLDDINKAFNGANNLFYFCMIVSTVLTFYLPYFIYMSIYLYTVNVFLPFAIIIAFIPSMLTMITNVKIMSKFEDAAAPVRREMDYYSETICSIEHMKETRIFGLFGYFSGLFSRSLKDFNKKESFARKRIELINLGLNIISLIGYGAVILYVMFLLIDGTIGPGYFAAIYAYIGLVFIIMNEIINTHLGNLSKNYGLIRNFIRFLDLKEISGETGVMDSNPSIEIKNVSFRYPKSDHESLTDISLEIKSGETLAIVGQNGAGKTTLVRLITGIYNPTQGDITIGNLNTSKISPVCIYESVTGVFQKFQKYKMTLDDNVKISQMKKGDPISGHAVASGIDIDNADIYPKGIETMLSREFDGIDLSGGQWQRVALARGFYRDHKLIVLDEPTAAIDPLEETKIYKQFIEIAKDKTAVIVTHRMGSAKLADRIVVMDNGRIVDIGTHEELMQRGKLYYEMFTAQSVWYDRKVDSLLI